MMAMPVSACRRNVVRRPGQTPSGPDPAKAGVLLVSAPSRPAPLRAATRRALHTVRHAEDVASGCRAASPLHDRARAFRSPRRRLCAPWQRRRPDRRDRRALARRQARHPRRAHELAHLVFEPEHDVALIGKERCVSRAPPRRSSAWTARRSVGCPDNRLEHDRPPFRHTASRALGPAPSADPTDSTYGNVAGAKARRAETLGTCAAALRSSGGGSCAGSS
jgi:hypothetical protein